MEGYIRDAESPEVAYFDGFGPFSRFFFVLDLKLWKTFIKLQDPLKAKPRRGTEIEGYTRDAKSAKITHFRRKLG